jgi:hypothetical protein
LESYFHFIDNLVLTKQGLNPALKEEEEEVVKALRNSMLQTSSCLAKHWNSVSYLHVGPNNTKLQIMILLKSCK